jgi:hypothetical protein
MLIFSLNPVLTPSWLLLQMIAMRPGLYPWCPPLYDADAQLDAKRFIPISACPYMFQRIMRIK